MMHRRLTLTAAAALLLACCGSAALARIALPTPAPAPGANHSLFSRRHPRGTAGSMTPFPNAIIGNKQTHVYHLPGDTGNMPAPKNRVYFHSEAEARAAGFHAAARRGAGSATGHRRTRPLGTSLHGRRALPPSSQPAPTPSPTPRLNH